jgi:hypothetical protein
MATAPLHIAWIDGDKTIRAGRVRALTAAHGVQRGAAVIEADEDELVYEITFDVPDEGLLQVPLGEDRDNTSILVIALDDDKTHDEIQDVRRHLTRARRSVVGNQPYDTYEPRITFLQLGKGASAQECTRGESPSTNDQGAKTPDHNDIAYGTND